MGKLTKGALTAVNGILDMAHDARMARAKEMGFDTEKTWYHGTRRDFDGFQSGSAQGAGEGVYLTDNPAAASEYAAGPGGQVIPVYTRNTNPSDFGYPGDEAIKRTATWNNHPEVIRARQAGLEDEIDLDPYDLWTEDENLANEAVRAGGHDSILSPLQSGDDGMELVVFDPSQIRSVNAAFDPAKKDSSNLLASLALGGVLTGAMLPTEDATAAELVQATGPDRGTIANQLLALSQQGDANPDTVQNLNGSPLLVQLANGLESNTQSPLGESHVQGIVDLLRKWGYREQASPLDYGMAALDVAP